MTEPAHRVRHGVGTWSLRRWATLTAIFAVILTVGAILGGGIAIYQLGKARSIVVDRLDPALRDQLRLTNALVNEETGVRGYALSAQEDFLDPYRTGVDEEQAATADLRTALGDRFPVATAHLNDVVAAADRWRSEFAEPTIDTVRTSRKALSSADIDRGKALFDQVRATFVPLDHELQRQQAQARRTLDRSANALTWTAIAIGLALLAGTAALISGLIRGVIRPVGQIGTDVRKVADGDFEHEVVPSGPREIRNLAGNVESMRERILAELAAVQEAHATLAVQATDLERSNSELEQFAYVASHDLQEPLRKVASFCELLDARYGDQLDDRGKQYIGFAVDGATRMQSLINDLLAFSRVGRLEAETEPVDMNEVYDSAVANLATAITDTGATVTAPGRLPTINGDATLLSMVMQNLIANGIKFRRPEQPPVITVEARDRGRVWQFTVTDNGIGIEADYADRIFVIFQRLHPKSAYPGTGIGLAMCRKIVEFHGGQIWLDTSYTNGGSRFHFTLPRRTAADIRRAIARQAALTNGNSS
jgi:signal transduction histidine kinase